MLFYDVIDLIILSFLVENVSCNLSCCCKYLIDEMCLAESGIVFHWLRFLFSQTGSMRSHTTLQRTQPHCYLNLASPWLNVIMSTGQFVLLCLPHINNVQNADVTAEVCLRPKWMKNKTKQNLYKFIWEKVARKWRTTGVTELNYHQISLLIESFHDKKKMAQNIYAHVVISYGIDHQLVYVVKLLITSVQRISLIPVHV